MHDGVNDVDGDVHVDDGDADGKSSLSSWIQG